MKIKQFFDAFKFLNEQFSLTLFFLNHTTMISKAVTLYDHCVFKFVLLMAK